MTRHFMPSSSDGHTTQMAIVLANDASGSMTDDDKHPQSVNANVKFIEQSDLSVAHIAIIRFGPQKTAKLVQDFTDNEHDLLQTVRGSSPNGNTPMAQALSIARDKLNTIDAEKKALVINSDGMPNDDTNRNILKLGDKIKKDGVRLITVAIGEGEAVDRRFMRKLASTDEDAYVAEFAGQLTETYENIQASLMAR